MGPYSEHRDGPSPFLQIIYKAKSAIAQAIFLC